MADTEPTTSINNFVDEIPAAVDLNSPVYDPFVHPPETPWYNPIEFGKMVLVGLFLLPFRLFFSIFWFLVYTLFLVIGSWAVRDLSQPPSKWRRFWTSGILNTFVNLGFKLTDWFSFNLGYPFLQTYGDKSMMCKETGEYANIIVANHSSYMDILLLMTTCERVPGFVGKVEIQKVPIVGWYSKVWQCLYVDRGKGAQGVTQKLKERSSDRRYPPVVIFPEGTTTNGKFLLPFKSGAFVSGKPVKPVAIKYVYSKFSPTWESVTAPPHMLKSFLQVYNHCEMYYLPVYVPNDDEKADPHLYAENVRLAMAEVLGAELSDSELKDKIAYLKALRGKFDAS